MTGRLGRAIGRGGHDYLHINGKPRFIECNPRTVEPGNAAAAGVDLPALTIALSRGDSLAAGSARIGRPGIRTRSALALIVGAAERGTRRAGATTLADLLAHRGNLAHAHEVLTPILRDPPSMLPLTVTTTQVLINPARAASLARGAVRSYSVTPAEIDRVRSTRP